eukprot:5415914-Alexandrium_andersonii.AAC.1
MQSGLRCHVWQRRQRQGPSGSSLVLLAFGYVWRLPLGMVFHWPSLACRSRCCMMRVSSITTSCTR